VFDGRSDSRSRRRDCDSKDGGSLDRGQGRQQNVTAWDGVAAPAGSALPGPVQTLESSVVLMSLQ
jgi:hypothetical protein